MKKDKFKDLILEAVEMCEENIIELAEEHFTTDNQKIDFVMSAAINLLGNLTVENSVKSLDAIKNNAGKTVGHLCGWFQAIIDELEESEKSTKQ